MVNVVEVEPKVEPKPELPYLTRIGELSETIALIKNMCTKRSRVNKKLQIDQFCDLYVVSAIQKEITEEEDKNIIMFVMNEILKSYISICKCAIRNEARHIFGCTSNSNSSLAIMFDNLGLDPYTIHFTKYRRRLKLSQAQYLFKHCLWNPKFGGRLWDALVDLVVELEQLKLITWNQLGNVITHLDIINHAEHNTGKFLRKYCAFAISSMLNVKASCGFRYLVMHASKDIRKIAEPFIDKFDPKSDVKVDEKEILKNDHI